MPNRGYQSLILLDVGAAATPRWGRIESAFSKQNMSFGLANLAALVVAAAMGELMAREVADVPAVGGRRIVMGYEEWLRWNPEGVRSEWVDGEVIVFVPTTVRHADLVGFLYTLLSSYARFFALGRVFMETVEMWLAHAGRVPDILLVARAHLDRLTDKRLLGPADLVVELVSDDSVERDREETFREYAAEGIPEYWLLDARSGLQQADFYQLAPDGTYRRVPPDADGRYRSAALPGFWFRPDWLWQEPLPDALACFATIAPDAVRAALASAVPGEDT